MSIMQNNIKITFGIIVLNGMPFIRYNIRAIYPFAHEIIIVEGAAPSAKYFARENGHSKDETLDELRRFQVEEDFQKKVIIVTAEDEGYPNGFWPEKDEMSQAYAKRATGNYLWQIDSDEFYLEEDMKTVISMLASNPKIKAVSFPMLTFWGSPNYRVNGYFLDMFMVHRIFAWGPGFQYLSHRPVTVLDNQQKDLRTLKWISPTEMRAKGIFMYHYELVFTKQVEEKCSYYAGAQWTTALQKANKWFNECYLTISQPFRVHMMYNYISWLEKHTGKHPHQVVEMSEAVNKGEFPGISFRDMKDADELLKQGAFRIKSILLKSMIPVARFLQDTKNFVKRTDSGQWLIKLKRSMRGDLMNISENDVSKKLIDGWKSPSIPALQRKLTESELTDMYQGKIITPYKVLADNIREIDGIDKTMIEIGCSTGYYYEVLSHLLGKPVQYTGVDYSPSMVEEAKKNYPAAAFKEADACAMPYNDEQFDIVISGCCLLHIPNYKTAIAETARIASEWVIFHRTPIVHGATQYYKKKAYGVPCVEIHFNEADFIQMCTDNRLEIRKTVDIVKGDQFAQRTYIFRKQPA